MYFFPVSYEYFPKKPWNTIRPHLLFVLLSSIKYLTSDGSQALSQSLPGSLYLACKRDQACNILGRKQKMQTFICQVFPKTAVQGFCLPPSTSASPQNCSFLQSSPSFSQKVMPDKSLFFSKMNTFFSREQLCKGYFRFYINSGFGSQTFLCPSQPGTWFQTRHVTLCRRNTKHVPNLNWH